MKKNIIKVYQCGGGNGEVMVDFIAIKFDDGTTEYIPNDFTLSVKKQVRDYIKNKVDDTTN